MIIKFYSELQIISTISFFNFLHTLHNTTYTVAIN